MKKNQNRTFNQNYKIKMKCDIKYNKKNYNKY